MKNHGDVAIKGMEGIILNEHKFRDITNAKGFTGIRPFRIVKGLKKGIFF